MLPLMPPILAGALALAPMPDPCLAGGGASGRAFAAEGAKGGQRYPLASGARPVAVLITVTQVSATGNGTAWLYADGRAVAGPLKGGHAQALTGRELWIAADPDVEVRYCLRFAG